MPSFCWRKENLRWEYSKDPANLLSPTALDPNAHTPEFKGFLVKLEKA